MNEYAAPNSECWIGVGPSAKSKGKPPPYGWSEGNRKSTFGRPKRKTRHLKLTINSELLKKRNKFFKGLPGEEFRNLQMFSLRVHLQFELCYSNRLCLEQATCAPCQKHRRSRRTARRLPTAGTSSFRRSPARPFLKTSPSKKNREWDKMGGSTESPNHQIS